MPPETTPAPDGRKRWQLDTLYKIQRFLPHMGKDLNLVQRLTCNAPTNSILMVIFQTFKEDYRLLQELLFILALRLDQEWKPNATL